MDERKNYTVYLITNMINGKQYAGITHREIGRRWIEHLSKARKGLTRSLSFAIRKHGECSFKVVSLREGLTRHQAGEEEKLIIRTLHLTDRKYGYNMTEGGEGGVPTPEIVEKICKSRGMKRDSVCGDKFYVVELPTEELVREYVSGTSTPTLAKKYRCSPGTIIRRLKGAGATLRSASERTKLIGAKQGYGFQKNIPNNTGSKRSPETREKMRRSNKQRRNDVDDAVLVQLYQEGKSTPQIAFQFSMTHPAIQRRLRNNGVILRPPGVH